ncbi:MAG: hypothetical protein JKY27_01885 [Magnetovibrio sp.]|nr:hypothetical protein [Magnetovibrio sp.]
MLQISPDNKVDAKPFDAKTFDGSEDALVCAQCHTFVTRKAWSVNIGGRAQHFCVNPHGIEFQVLSFSDAPGALANGRATTEATWFAGYAWRLAVCGACDVHLGWRFEGANSPSRFFGLIHEALVDQPDVGEG